ncbi:SNARE protein, putative [Plasmodium ovale curtisi]|uniref:SNARE protein, putative n=1 Tax=Plasmodium ovale curtisi TaxID=864141 RepID=A0A1A8W7E2_PLAOA|nr:SNARE protein, putative [Plasmodium ovale curtisi]SBS97861.1 SNARE protein, putative [Plasmodium ovale curtisi]
MSIIYGLVAREKTVLAEYTEFGGNFSNISRLLLEIIPPHSARKSYIYDEYYYEKMRMRRECELNYSGKN